jgi:hypothetical protein
MALATVVSASPIWQSTMVRIGNKQPLMGLSDGKYIARAPFLTPASGGPDR